MPESTILGIGEMRQNFAQINDAAIQTRIGRRMVAAAGNILKAEAKSLATQQGLRRTGAMIKNIVIKRETKAPPGTVQYNLGVRHGRGLTKKQKLGKLHAVNKSGRIVTKYIDDPFYWRFLELGTKHQQATPFISTALDNKSTQAIDAMGAALTTQLQKLGFTP